MDEATVIPHATDLEKVILGSILIEKGALMEVMDVLKPEHMYRMEHKLIYQSMLSMNELSVPIDLVTVTEHLSKTNSLHDAGNYLYLTQLTGKVSTATHIREHSMIVKQKYLQRSLVQQLQVFLSKSYDDFRDVGDTLDELNEFVESVNQESLSSGALVHISDVMTETIAEIRQAEKNVSEGGRQGVDTGLNSLNDITGGWQNGELIILGGRPSMGKTAVGLHFALSAARQGKAVAMFSLEMEKISLGKRMLLSVSDVSPDDLKVLRLTAHDWKGMEDGAEILKALPIYIDDQVGNSPKEIKTKARMLKIKSACDLIIIDYLQLTDMTAFKDRQREQQVAQTVLRIKNMAKELKVPVLLLSQLNREVDKRRDHRPMLSDLRESGAIEQDADIVGFVYRPEYYKVSTFDDGVLTEGKGELLIEKNRNGRVGTIRFGYNKSMTRISDVDDKLYDKYDSVKELFYDED